MTDHGSIVSEHSLEKVRDHLEKVGYVAVLHWHLFGARHPTPLAFHDIDDFQDYVRTSGNPGDAFDVWPFPQDDCERIAFGKVPEADGTIRAGGSY